MVKYVKKDIIILLYILTILIMVLFAMDIKKYIKQVKDTDVFYINKFFNIEKRNMLNIANKSELKVQNIYSEVLRKKSLKVEEQIKTVMKKNEKNNVSNINIYKTNTWRIKIPSLKVDAPIADGTSQEALRRTVGHFEQSSKWNGNVALAGHNRGYRCNFFQDIKKLKKGDKIIYTYKKRERIYKVESNKVIKETDWSYINKTNDNRITLITCEENKREYRRCIQAIEIK